MYTLAEVLDPQAIEDLEGLFQETEGEEEVHPLVEGMWIYFQETDPRAEREARLERAFSRLGEAWRVAAAGDRLAQEAITLARRGQVEALEAFRVFEAEELKGLKGDAEAREWVLRHARELDQDEDPEWVQVRDGFVKAVTQGLPARAAEAAAQRAVLGEASVGALAPHEASNRCPLPVTPAERRRMAVAAARDLVRVLDRALAAGDLYRKVQEALDQGLARAIQAAEAGDRAMAEALGAVGRHQGDLPPRWRSWLAGRFPAPDLADGLVRRVVFNSFEDHPKWRSRLLERARIEAAAAEIYLAVFHRRGPLVGRPAETWPETARKAAGYIAFNDRRLPDKIRKRLAGVAAVEKEQARTDEFVKVRIFSLPVRDLRALKEARAKAMKRAAELARWKGGRRRRWRVAAEAAGILSNQ